MMARILLILGLLAVPAMAEEYWVPDYNIALIRVEVDGRERTGVISARGNVYVFQDSIVGLAWSFSPKAAHFRLENNTHRTIKIAWDGSAYVDHAGNSLRVVHKDVSPLKMGQPQIPTPVPAGSAVQDMVVPADYLFLNELSHEWDITAFFEPCDRSRIPILLETAKLNIGRQVRILLALDIAGKVVDHLFTFEVKGVEIRKVEE